MKKIAVFVFISFACFTYASEKADKLAAERQAKQAERQARLEEKRKALVIEAEQLQKSDPEKARKRALRSIQVAGDSPTGNYIISQVESDPIKARKYLEAAAASGKESEAKQKAQRALAVKEIDENISNFTRELSTLIKKYHAKVTAFYAFKSSVRNALGDLVNIDEIAAYQLLYSAIEKTMEKAKNDILDFTKVESLKFDDKEHFVDLVRIELDTAEIEASNEFFNSLLTAE